MLAQGWGSFVNSGVRTELRTELLSRLIVSLYPGPWTSFLIVCHGSHKLTFSEVMEIKYNLFLMGTLLNSLH